MANIFDVVKNFKIEGEVKDISKYGTGHINRTYLLVTDKKRYILQGINTVAFKDVDLLMNNINYVTSFLINNNKETLNIVRTNDDKLYFKCDDGECYRIYDFVENSLTLEEVDNQETLIKDAKAFGQFHKFLKTLDASKLGEVIPHFHDTVSRMANFEKSISNDIKNRKLSCQKEIDSYLKYKNDISRIMDGLKNGSLPLGVTHNDPKINNILFDADTVDVRCIIDLDTIMPGSYLFDYGDALRSLFTRSNEDSTNLDLLKVDFDTFKGYTYGYLSEMKDVLTKEEISLLPYSAFLLTYECGIRFLSDYLDGDVYFHTAYPEHNLIRARTQLTLSEDIYKNLDKLNSIVDDIIKTL